MSAASPILDALREALGAAQLSDTAADRRLYSQDVYRDGVEPLAIVRPNSTAQVQRLVRVALDHGVALFVRGGGMSYTDAYLPDRAHALIVDMGDMTRIRSIAPQDLHATAEAGCTWAALDEALAPHGLRARFWGPMSGRAATLGGGMSQGAATFGSARHGTSASAALGFEVVLGDGSVLDTSCTDTRQSAFFRPYGPDLTGLYTGDAGALGIKTAVTLQLEPRPAVHGALSFGYAEFGAMRESISAVAREGLASEIFGLETSLLELVAGATANEPAWRTALAVARAQSGPLRAFVQLAKLAQGGRDFAGGTRYVANVICEARDAARLSRTQDEIRALATRSGREIPNTMAAVVRATPFPAPMLLGPGGRRLLALHAILPHSAVDAFHAQFERLRETEAAALGTHRAGLYGVFAVVGPSAVLHEPVIYWEDEWNALQRASLPEALRAQLRPAPPNPAARAYVEALRVRLVDLMQAHGAVHLQIGRAYPYLRGRSQPFIDALQAIKRQTDPRNLLNPGALGLAP